jgi:hypothetical protein
MTDKDRVLSMYENAHIWIMNPKGMVPLYYVQYWSDSSAFIMLARRHKNEEDAWEAAWNYIQKKMLSILES